MTKNETIKIKKIGFNFGEYLLNEPNRLISCY